jgi:hypothetical protein
MSLSDFPNLDAVAAHLRATLDTKKYVLLYAYNSTGKTRLSIAFKNLGKQFNDEGETIEQDTLYFNAFTEDLFSWDNDLESDVRRVLRINRDSRFFNGLQELEMESRIGRLLERYADFNFFINYETWEITFFRERDVNGDPIAIKVSRGEENIFVWCFFLSIVRLAIDGQAAYTWVKHIYIDDPISSLDDNNAVSVAHHLAQMFKKANTEIKLVVSSHHTLFFNVMCNELSKPVKYFLSKSEETGGYSLRVMKGDTARFYHVAMLRVLKKAADSGELFTYHFSILRSVMEKTATFHGYTDFGHFINVENDDEEKTLLRRLIQVLNHGGYSLMEPVEMLPENKGYFRKILNDFLGIYSFNQEIFSDKNTRKAVT